MAEATSRDPFSNIPIDDFSNLSVDHTGGHVQSHIEQYPHGQQYGLQQQKQQQYPEQQSAFVSYGHHNNTVNQTYRNGAFNGAAPHHIQYSDPQSYIANYTHTQNPYVTSQNINANSIQYPCGSSKIECLSQSVTRILPAQTYQRQHQDVPQPQTQPKYHDHDRHPVQLVPQTATEFSRIQQQRPIQPTYQISLVEQQQQAQLINFSTVSSITASQTTSKPTADVEQHYHSWYVEDDLSSIDSPPLSKEDSVDKNAPPEMTAVSSSGGSSADDTEKTSGGIKKRSSYRTQSTFTSYYCESPLDKATFAPPPSHPLTAIPKSKLPYLQHSESAVQDSNFPIFSKITHSGHLSARLSAKSLILKKWKRVFWIAYGDCELFMFRSRADFDEWVTNPYMTKQERNEIVKLRVNFRKGANDNLGVRCYRASHVRSKDYGKSGNMLMFKLEQWMHHGPIVIGAFASSSKPEVGAFNIICNAMIGRQEYGLKHLVAEGRDDISDNLLLNYCKREHS